MHNANSDYQTDHDANNLRVPLVVHVIYRLAVGGLENGLVNLINHMPVRDMRHVIVCITDYTDFAQRIKRNDVDVIAMHKKPGKDLGFYWRMWRLLRRLRPDIVHTRNLGAIDIALPAFFAGVKFRLQGEHGRDTSDLDGSNRKYLLLRRLVNPFISHYIALSKDLAQWLENTSGVSPNKVTQIYNGVDCSRFSTQLELSPILRSAVDRGAYILGSVGRLQGEKNQALLVKAFAECLRRDTSLADRLLLVIVGDGPDRSMLLDLIQKLEIESQVLTGARDDVPNILTGFNLFVLPSLIEGVSNTILESMCMALPVIATDVGGNRELIVDNETGTLVASNDVSAMADAIDRYCRDPALGKARGEKGKQRVLTQFTMAAMVENYLKVYRKRV